MTTKIVGILAIALLLCIIFQWHTIITSGIDPNTVLVQPMMPSTNYVFQNGKLVPLTVLSEADAKKGCIECHPK